MDFTGLTEDEIKAKKKEHMSSLVAQLAAVKRAEIDLMAKTLLDVEPEPRLGTPEPVEATVSAALTPEPVEATAVAPPAATPFGPKFKSKDLTQILRYSQPGEQFKKGCDYLNHYFKVVNGKQVVQLTYDKGKPVSHKILTKEEAKALVNKNRVDDVNLMKAFIESADYDQYEGIVFDPANSQQEDVINTFYGLRGQNLLESGVTPNKQGLKFMLDHLKALCGDNDEHFQYVLDVLSYPIKNPGEKSDIALIVKGPEGCGKTAFFKRFIANKIYGKLLSKEVHGEVGTFQAKLAQKLFIIIDEMHKMGNKAIDLIKAAITCDERDFNEKLKVAFTAKDHANWVCLTNKDSPELLGRRTFFVEASNKFTDKPEYFDLLHELIDDEGTAVAFYQYLKEHPIQIFKKGKQALMTPFKERLMKQDIDPLVHYFKHLIDTDALPKPRETPPAGSPAAKTFKPADARRMYASEFKDGFCKWCDEHGYKDFKPKGVTKLKKRVDTLFSRYYHDVTPGWEMVKHSQVECDGPTALAFILPEPDVLKGWLAHESTE